MENKQRISRILQALRKEYPCAKTPLLHKDPLQLLIATILSAQCTDERVNKVTPPLFAKYKNARDFAVAKPAELEDLIRSTGFYKAKAKNIIGCCKGLVGKHKGEVPASLEALVELPGVGRKTANVVLGEIWDIPGVVVDTHVKRLTFRMGLTKNTDPEKIERDIMNLLAEKDWNDFSVCLIFHGRRVCFARKPLCGGCKIADLCPKFGIKRGIK
ncbi:MAG: endonuclease III [Deltaproteobacteria bacterium CG11_big_fil_rev_8_21_14_0_20_49_13]|nr:MAG: endonuclease III [Deltaproteobacteria bacterium CG11_big_fil_rev_8_21_14_0_20_49_13]